MVNHSTPALQSFAAAVDALREKHRVECGFAFAARFGAIIAPIAPGSKFVRIMSTETPLSPTEKAKQSIYAFVAMVDSETKSLGTVKAGDVMKPATWKAPAKHARGNIFDAANGLGTCNSYGPGYLQ
jgi:hypothetical protein